jgi:hypothetical protein
VLCRDRQRRPKAGLWAAKLLTKDEARRIAANVAEKLATTSLIFSAFFARPRRVSM